jgi:hypothetical protein
MSTCIADGLAVVPADDLDLAWNLGIRAATFVRYARSMRSDLRHVTTLLANNKSISTLRSTQGEK